MVTPAPAVTAEAQGALWSQGANDWAELLEPCFSPLYQAGFAAAGLGPGMSLLEAGCGAGLAAETAVKTGAQVHGCDTADGMLEIARRRLPHVDFRVADLQRLPYGDGWFDVVTGFNSFQYAADPIAALREAVRVCRRGGRVLVATWGPPAACAAAGYMKAVADLLPPPPPGVVGPFALSADGALEALLDRAGLGHATTFDVACAFWFPDLRTLLRGVLSSGNYVKAVSVRGREHVAHAITNAVADHRTADGSYQLDNVFRCSIGVRPKC